MKKTESTSEKRTSEKQLREVTKKAYEAPNLEMYAIRPERGFAVTGGNEPFYRNDDWDW